MRTVIFNNIVDFENNLEHQLLKEIILVWDHDKILTTYKKAENETEYLLMHFNNNSTNIYGLIKKEKNNDYQIACFLDGKHWIKDNLKTWSIVDMDSLYLQWLLDEKLNEIEDNLKFSYVYDLLDTKEYKKFDKYFHKRVTNNESTLYQIKIGSGALKLNNESNQLFNGDFLPHFKYDFLNVIKNIKIKFALDVTNETYTFKKVNISTDEFGVDTINFDFDKFKIIMQLYELNSYVKLIYFDKELITFDLEEKWFNDFLDGLEEYHNIVYKNRDNFAYFEVQKEHKNIKFK